MIHPYRVSDFINPAEKERREASKWGLNHAQKDLLREGTEAKKRMFNLANRHPIENKETLDEQTGANRPSKPERSGGTG